MAPDVDVPRPDILVAPETLEAPRNAAPAGEAHGAAANRSEETAEPVGPATRR